MRTGDGPSPRIPPQPGIIEVKHSIVHSCVDLALRVDTEGVHITHEQVSAAAMPETIEAERMIKTGFTIAVDINQGKGRLDELSMH